MQREGEISSRTFVIVMLGAVTALAAVWGFSRVTSSGGGGPQRGLVVQPLPDGAPDAAAGHAHGRGAEAAPPPPPPSRPPRSPLVIRGRARFDEAVGRTGAIEVDDFGARFVVRAEEVEEVEVADGEAVLHLLDGRNVAVPERLFLALPASWRYRADYVRASGNVDAEREEILRRGDPLPAGYFGTDDPEGP